MDNKDVKNKVDKMSPKERCEFAAKYEFECSNWIEPSEFEQTVYSYIIERYGKEYGLIDERGRTKAMEKLDSMENKPLDCTQKSGGRK